MRAPARSGPPTRSPAAPAGRRGADRRPAPPAVDWCRPRPPVSQRSLPPRPTFDAFEAKASESADRRPAAAHRGGLVNIVVCVKRVPDTAADKVLDPQDFTLDRESVDSIINPVDEYAVEEAL